jgi:TetR/AcrR family transcriptional repressor of mexJK operon
MKRTPEKRQAILDAAVDLFGEGGYERASMSDIGLRTGFSKTTVYGYFASREALLEALAEEATEAGVADVQAALAPGKGLVATLEDFADAYLRFALSPRVCTLRRVLVATAGRLELHARWRDLGAARINVALAAWLRAGLGAQVLPGLEAHAAARQLKALLEAPWTERMLFDHGAAPGPGQLEQELQFALAAFLRAWPPAGGIDGAARARPGLDAP